MYFDLTGPELTGKSAEIAVNAAVAKNISHIVAASNTGDTIFAILKEKEKQGYKGKIICVPHVYGFRENGKNELSDENRKKLEDQGVGICIAAHALSGGERSLSRKFQGVYPVEMIAHTLRMFGQGTKVCVEIGAMALDAGHIPWGEPIIAMGGTGRGADTAILLTPSYTHGILETKIHEILCKPRL